MERRILGRTGMEVSVLGFGGAEIGYQNASVETVAQILGSALDAGLNVIDTAECYGDSEEMIGRTVGNRRSEYYIFTKCGHASGIDLPDWDPRLLEQSIDRSLKRLRTDCLDLVMLHTCSEELLRQGDVVAAVQKARDAGKTRWIGYSGDGHKALFAVHSRAFDVLETSVSIADQEAIDLTLPAARKERVGVIAKRPLANVIWRYASRPDGAYGETYWDRLQALDYDFLKANFPESVGTALRFTLRVPGVDTAIVGTTHPERWRHNAAMLDQGALSEEEYNAILERWKAVAAPDWVGQG